MRTFLLLLSLLPLLPALGAPAPRYGSIELLRDPWGIPHIFSETDAGAFYGLGYATAEDRGFQMTYNLRLIQGRSAEILGEIRMATRNETTLDHDRRMRAFGFHRAARRTVENLDAETVALLQAYADGVNASFAEQRAADRLHPLFAELGFLPEQWRPEDCLAAWWHLGRFFATDGTRDLIAYRNRDQMARDESMELPPDEAASIVRREDVSTEWIEALNTYARERNLLPPSDPQPESEAPSFSHAWVAGGSRTTTGSSVLVSLPQTPVRNPSLFYPFHIQGETFNARGIGVPGSPGLLIGFTENVAWGITALGADQADLFLLDTSPDRPDEYRFDGQWRPMRIHRETIRVRGGDPVEITVRETHLGPVATAFAFARPDEGEVALRRIPLAEHDRETIQGVLAMIRAANAEEFNAALEGWRFPSVNVVFGDREGNIGYKSTAAIPVRAPGQSGRFAMEGHRSNQEWQEILPYEFLPQVMNPRSGHLFSGNHRTIESWYPFSLGAMTGAGGDTTRSWRLRELLESRERFTPEQVLEIHRDAVNPARRDLVAIALRMRESGVDLNSDARAALAHLEPWFHEGASSALTAPGAALAGELNLFFRPGATRLPALYGGGESGLAYFLKTVVSRIATKPETGFSRDEVLFIEQALTDSWQSAHQKFGTDPDAWNRRAHTASQERPIAYMQGLDGFGSLWPDLDLTTPPLNVIDGGTLHSQSGQAYTQWVPMHDPDQALSMLPIGQSERPDHPARLNTVDLWSSGDLHPAPLSRHRVEELAVSSQRLDRPESAAIPRPSGDTPEVWLCHGNLQPLVERPEAWSFVRDHLDGIKLYVDRIGDRGRNGLSDPDLGRLAALAETHGIQFAVEAGGTLEFAPLTDENGIRSAAIELAKIQPLTEAGGTLAFLDIDGAINRLLYPGPGRRGFDSIDDCVTQLIAAMRAHRQTYPDLQFWLLTNFPNWGWKGEVSYHARGPNRQDWGDYFPVLETVIRRTREEDIPIAGVTVDNPYDYATGAHFSVNLENPADIDWIGRIRDLENHVVNEGLDFNLIVNSQAGGHLSDEAFFHDTLAFVDAYLAAGGRPHRWIVQSWYAHPRAVLPDDGPHSMIALVEAVIRRVKPGLSQPTAERPAPPSGRRAPERITLTPRQGAMTVAAHIPHLNATFALGIPETIGSREAMLLNFPEATIEWRGPDENGVVSTTWGRRGHLAYSARLIPFGDHIDVEMTIRNLSESSWRDVFSFNCLNPVNAPAFLDWTLDRTYMSSGGKPLRMAETERVRGHMPTVGFYLHERIERGQEPAFVRGFRATSPNRTDGDWIVTLSDPPGSYMAAAVPEALFLFDNLDRCCIHAAPLFGDIAPGESSTTVSRFYFAHGDLDTFLTRLAQDRATSATNHPPAR